MLIYQPGILHQKSILPQKVTGVLHPKNAARKQVRFSGLSPAPSLNMSDRVSIGSGYQPLPIPRASEYWLEAPAVFQDVKHKVPQFSTQENFGTMKHQTSRNNVSRQLNNKSRYGHNVQNSSTFAQPSEHVESWKKAFSSGSSREVIYPRFHDRKDYPYNLRVLDLTDSRFMAPRVAPSNEVVQLPAYSMGSKLQEHVGLQRNRLDDVTSERPFDSSSQNLNDPSINSLIIGAKDMSQKHINKRFLFEGKSYTNYMEDHGETTRSYQAPQNVPTRSKTIGVVRYTVPTSTGKNRTVLIKVDYSIPSMDMIKVDHGHPGNIYIGNFGGACSSSLCQKNKIDAIINMSIKVIKKHSKITYYAFPINDLPGEDIVRLFNMTSNIIEGHLKAGENVLVNCNMGVSRSTTIVLAYIIRKTGMDVDSALALCRKFRPCCNPNYGFIEQLKKYYLKIRESNFRRTVGTDMRYRAAEDTVYLESFGDKKEVSTVRRTTQKSGRDFAPEVKYSATKEKARQKFPFSFSSCYARYNMEDAPASNKRVVPRRVYTVL